MGKLISDSFITNYTRSVNINPQENVATDRLILLHSELTILSIIAM